MRGRIYNREVGERIENTQLLRRMLRGRIWRATMRSVNFRQWVGAMVAHTPLQNPNQPTDARRFLERGLGSSFSTARPGEPRRYAARRDAGLCSI